MDYPFFHADSIKSLYLCYTGRFCHNGADFIAISPPKGCSALRSTDHKGNTALTRQTVILDFRTFLRRCLKGNDGS